VPQLFYFSQFVSAGGSVCLGGNVDWQAEFAMQDAHAARVVYMVVGDQDRIDAGRIPVVEGEPLSDPAAAYSGIEQQLDSACFNVDAVAVAAGLKGYDTHGRIISTWR
jgi:hypothetical protein